MTTANGDPIVEITKLSKIYHRRRGDDIKAVEDLDLTLGQAGAVHGFLGPNGSGKTTTIRCLLGLIRPTNGQVEVFGADSTRHFHRVASRVGAIVENPKMFPNFSARKNLSLLARTGGIPSREVDRVLEVVGLADRGGDNFGSYSLGMRQRLAIAGALLKDPDLLILDEPANGLDPAGIAEIRVLIRTIADEGKAVLVSSHQLAEVEQVCNDITIIDHGRLVKTGTVDEIRTFAGPDRVIVTIDDRAAAITTLAQAGIGAHPTPVDNELAVDIEAGESAIVTKALAERGLYLSGLRSERASLETAFLELTGGSPPPPPGPPPPASPESMGSPSAESPGSTEPMEATS
ncbi:MAG: ATP-binding cassette domain-containing protein [Actinomycetia bacterium]|nr:ATP-binding cassette domain-containing protein [Actinomycetes bacterium]MCP4223235.1 ATP-binding cassette domain-containing protein [Actinomycetes bacterium]MCP5034804.1 ATP-binding cassette domain-containing protein [Actinomycetes bacterium]